MALLKMASHLLVLITASGFESDIISDLVSPAADEGRALDIKTTQFWETIQHSSAASKLNKHSALYAEVEAVMAALPTENSHVKSLLQEALGHLKQADMAVGEHSAESTELASEKLAAKPMGGSMFSFMKGGQNFLSLAIKRFVGGSDYADQSSQQVASRQGDVLPALRGAASKTGNVLTDCRLASKLSFDALKYDLYNKGVPKTPKAAEKAAYALAQAAGETRHQFMQSIIGFANALATDTEEKNVNPSAKVTQTLLSDMQPFGTKVDLQGGLAVEHEEPLIIHEDR